MSLPAFSSSTQRIRPDVASLMLGRDVVSHGATRSRSAASSKRAWKTARSSSALAAASAGMPHSPFEANLLPRTVRSSSSSTKRSPSLAANEQPGTTTFTVGATSA